VRRPLERSSTAVIVTSLLATAVVLAGTPTGVDYSLMPLAGEPVTSSADQGIEAARLGRVLESGDPIPLGQREELRRRVYVLIDGLVKERFAAGRIVFSRPDLSRVIRYYQWADTLKVPGAGQVVEYFRRIFAIPADEEAETSFNLPDPYRMELRFPNFQVRSEAAPWLLQYPYYLMTEDIRRVVPAEGWESDLIVVSTLFAPHRKDKGHSQSRILFAYSEAVEHARFQEHWLRQLGIENGKTVKNEVFPDAPAYSRLDKKKRQRAEVCFLHTDNGSAAIALVGIDGSYQKNRPHYLDFLRSLEL
jgi:hypothetical protein